MLLVKMSLQQCHQDKFQHLFYSLWLTGTDRKVCLLALLQRLFSSSLWKRTPCAHGGWRVVSIAATKPHPAPQQWADSTAIIRILFGPDGHSWETVEKVPIWKEIVDIYSKVTVHYNAHQANHSKNDFYFFLFCASMSVCVVVKETTSDTTRKTSS